MRVAIVLYCLVVAFLLFLVSDREEVSHECLEAKRLQAQKTDPPKTDPPNGSNTQSVKSAA